MRWTQDRYFENKAKVVTKESHFLSLQYIFELNNRIAKAMKFIKI